MSFDYTKIASIMADHSSDKTSNKYSFIPTKIVIRILEKHGWFVSSAREANSRKNAGYQPHVVRFRRQKDIGRILEVNEIVAEAILKTAHDGTTEWELSGGFQRCWCDNQCTVSAGTVAEHKIKHIGFTTSKVLKAINTIANDMPKIILKMKDFKSVKMSGWDKYTFAKKALDIAYKPTQWKRYDKNASARMLVKATRQQDEDSNLWNIYNICQEKLIKGSNFLLTPHMVNYYNAYNKGVMRGGAYSRGVKSIGRDLDINKKLWELAEKVELTSTGVY
jgi:hypothetical protein